MGDSSCFSFNVLCIITAPIAINKMIVSFQTTYCMSCIDGPRDLVTGFQTILLLLYSKLGILMNSLCCNIWGILNLDMFYELFS